MMSSHNPWVEIPAPPVNKFSRLRVTPDSSIGLFWIRDEANRPGLLIEISKVISLSSLNDAKINIRDISVDVLDMADEGIRALIIKLHAEQNLDVFLKLCNDLIEKVLMDETHANSFQIVCYRLKKWQSLLSGKVKSLLSTIEIQGLYAELYFICEMMAKRQTQETVIIKGWEGPDKTQHDFILNDTAVEIKSISGNQRGKVRISSEDQLDTHLSKMYLHVYFLSETQHINSGESLNDIVRRINALLTTADCRELFELKLSLARYIEIADYDLPRFLVKASQSYQVQSGFPCITRKNLPEGIEDVSYDLVLASIADFRTTLDLVGD